MPLQYNDSVKSGPEEAMLETWSRYMEGMENKVEDDISVNVVSLEFSVLLISSA